jgi:hypothetical protein
VYVAPGRNSPCSRCCHRVRSHAHRTRRPAGRGLHDKAARRRREAVRRQGIEISSGAGVVNTKTTRQRVDMDDTTGRIGSSRNVPARRVSSAGDVTRPIRRSALRPAALPFRSHSVSVKYPSGTTLLWWWGEQDRIFFNASAPGKPRIARGRSSSSFDLAPYRGRSVSGGYMHIVAANGRGAID